MRCPRAMRGGRCPARCLGASHASRDVPADVRRDLRRGDRAFDRPGIAPPGRQDPGIPPHDLKPRPPAFPPESHVGHPPIHERRAEPDGPVRSQADARQAPRPVVFRQDRGRGRDPQTAGALMRSPFTFGSTASRGCGSPTRCRTSRVRWTTSRSIRSMHTTNLTHEPAVYLIQSGKMTPGRPTLGSWVVYGLGSENQNLPAYVVLDDPLGLPVNGVENWQAGFLPPMFQGTRFRSTGSPMLNLRPEVDRPAAVSCDRARLARPARPDSQAPAAGTSRRSTPASPATNWRLACNWRRPMRSTSPERARRRWRCTASGSSRPTPTAVVASSPGGWWSGACASCSSTSTATSGTTTPRWRRTSRPHATAPTSPSRALLRDLKQRGLFDSTLVVWGGEFGRLPIAQLRPTRTSARPVATTTRTPSAPGWPGRASRAARPTGRRTRSAWPRSRIGSSVPDWHATILHLLGLHHDQLYIEQNGLKEKLTGVNEAKVVKGILS